MEILRPKVTKYGSTYSISLKKHLDLSDFENVTLVRLRGDLVIISTREFNAVSDVLKNVLGIDETIWAEFIQHCIKKDRNQTLFTKNLEEAIKDWNNKRRGLWHKKVKF